MELNNKKVMVVGTGISGIGAIDLLNKAGADCIIYDGNEKLSREDISKKLKGNKAEIIIGKLPEDITKQVDLLVISPGVPVDSPTKAVVVVLPLVPVMAIILPLS